MLINAQYSILLACLNESHNSALTCAAETREPITIPVTAMGSPSESAYLSVEVDTIEDDEEFMQDFLKPYLPYSLPLLRRCQFHAKQKQLTPGAEIYLATCSINEKAIGAEAETAVSSSQENDLLDNPPWLAAHIDLSNSGQTQIWTFASWEHEFNKELDPATAVQESPQYLAYQRLFEALFRHIHKEHIFKLGDQPPEQWQRLKAEGKLVSEPFAKSKVLFGTLAECLWPFLDALRTDRGDSAISRESRPYLKYIFSSREHEEVMSPPEGLRFAPVPEQYLQTIIDRTDIPRTVETIRQLPNIGLCDSNGRPIAWGLLSKDASLSSLHTEPEYRRQGLAETVARRLLVEQEKFYHDTENATSLTDDDDADAVVYGHADVSDSNVASRKVMEKVGGEVMWRTAWIEIDLGNV